MSDSRPLPEFGPEELRLLDAFADELRAAHPSPRLSPGFAERLAERQEPRWTFRRALQQNQLLRVAAGLLVAVAGSVPVMAVIQLLVSPDDRPPAIQVERLRAAPEIEVPETVELPATHPDPPDLAETLDESFVVAVDRQSRLNRASYRWHLAYPVEPPASPDLLTGRIDDHLQRGLALRFGQLASAAVPVLADWSQAGPEQLWLELERRLATEHPGMPVAPLVTRVRELWNAQPESRIWLAGWIWILDGERDPLLDQRPASGGPDLQVFWKAADRSSLVWPAD